MSSLGDEAVSLIEDSIAKMNSWLDDQQEEYQSKISDITDEFSELEDKLYDANKKIEELEDKIIELESK